MSHPQQLDYFSSLATQYPEYFNDAKVTEIGSLNLNGSVRSVFSNCEYIGYDLEIGAGVDIAEQGQLISLATSSIDTCISAECFEHNPFWVETFANMLRISRPGGLIAFSCATVGRQEHGTSRTSLGDAPFMENIGWDYYRNLCSEDFCKTFFMDGWFDAYHFMHCPETFDLYFFGLRKVTCQPFDIARFIAATDNMELHLQNVNKSIRIGRWTNAMGWEPRLKYILGA
jgi:SAM-dependent methyltransferase